MKAISPARRHPFAGLFVVLVGFAFAQGVVADLTVVAYGAQTLDLASGRTVLIDGGEIREASTDVRIVATWISFLEGVEILAEEAVLRGVVGEVTAPELRIDLADRSLVAFGGVAWLRNALEIRADTLFYDHDRAVVGAIGEIRSANPTFEGVALWIDLASQRALLLGPYTFQDGPLTLSGVEESALQLNLLVRDGEEVLTVTNLVDPDLRLVLAAAEARLIAGLR
jgi:hypothetical protein